MDNLSDKIDKIKVHPQGLAALSIASKIPVEDLMIVLQHEKEIPELKKYIIATVIDDVLAVLDKFTEKNKNNSNEFLSKIIQIKQYKSGLNELSKASGMNLSNVKKNLYGSKKIPKKTQAILEPHLDKVLKNLKTNKKRRDASYPLFLTKLKWIASQKDGVLLLSKMSNVSKTSIEKSLKEKPKISDKLRVKIELVLGSVLAELKSYEYSIYTNSELCMQKIFKVFTYPKGRLALQKAANISEHQLDLLVSRQKELTPHLYKKINPVIDFVLVDLEKKGYKKQKPPKIPQWMLDECLVKIKIVGITAEGKKRLANLSGVNTGEIYRLVHDDIPLSPTSYTHINDVIDSLIKDIDTINQDNIQNQTLNPFYLFDRLI